MWIVSSGYYDYLPLTEAKTAAEFGGADPAASIVNRHQSLAGKKPCCMFVPLATSPLSGGDRLCGISLRLCGYMLSPFTSPLYLYLMLAIYAPAVPSA